MFLPFFFSFLSLSLARGEGGEGKGFFGFFLVPRRMNEIEGFLPLKFYEIFFPSSLFLFYLFYFIYFFFFWNLFAKCSLPRGH